MSIISAMVTAFSILVIIGVSLLGFVWLVDHTPTWLFLTIIGIIIFGLLTTQFYIGK